MTELTFSGRKKSLIDIIISCQAESPACVIRFEHNAVLWLEHCFQLKSGCDLPGQGHYPDWQLYKRRRHVWWAERLGESTWGGRWWRGDQGAGALPCVHLRPAGWKGAGASHSASGIPRWWWHPMVMGSRFPSAARIHSKACEIKQFLPKGAWPEQRRRRNPHWKSYPQAWPSLRVIAWYLTRNMMMSLFGKTEGGWYLPQPRFSSPAAKMFPYTLCMGLLLKSWYARELAKLVYNCSGKLPIPLRPSSSFSCFPTRAIEVLTLDTEMALCSQSYDPWERLGIQRVNWSLTIVKALRFWISTFLLGRSRNGNNRLILDYCLEGGSVITLHR